MDRFFLFFTIFLLTSCGGGGGGGGGSSTPAIPFSITVNSFSISTDEDISYSGTLSATTNETTTVTFEAVTIPTSGSLTISSSGSYEYIPTLNFNGTDSFSYRALATLKSKNSSEATVSITVNAVDDAPVLTINDLPTNSSILYRDDQGKISLSGSVTDIDNDFTDLSFSSTFNDQEKPVTGDNENDLTISIDVSSIIDANRFDIEIKACSGVGSSLACDSESFNTYLASGYKDDGTYITYNLLGSYELGSTSPRNISMMILADSIDTGTLEIDRSDFRDQLTKNFNALMDGTVKDYVDGFFNVMIVEPSDPDGSSFVDVESGDDCEDNGLSEGTRICFDNEKLLALEESLYPNEAFDITQMMTAVDARYFAQDGTFFSGIGAWDETHTFLHELGHAHANLGDEYESRDDRTSGDDRDDDVAVYAIARRTNNTDKADPNNVQWKHLINDLTNVPGYHQTAGIDGVGHFEGVYWLEEGGFRPQVDSIMNGSSRCVETGACPNGKTQEYILSLNDYTHQHGESFVMSSINELIAAAYYGGSFASDESGARTSLSLSSGIFDERALDTQKIRLDWYVNGAKDASLTDTNSVTFDRPDENKWLIYSWTLSDKTGLATDDDPLDPTDAYGADIERYARSPYPGIYDDEDDEFLAYLSNGSLIDRPISVEEIEGKYPNDSYLFFQTPMGGALALNWRKYE
jgi:VCBS repeat-containing protein